MKAMVKRLDALEAGRPVLSPRVKQWLGWPLTDAERGTLDNGATVDPYAVDASGWSREAKAWLGVA